MSAHSEVARRYAKLAQRLVESVGSEVREVREVEEVSGAGSCVGVVARV